MTGQDRIKLALALAAILVGVGLIVAWGAGRSQTRGAPPPESHYFYDVQSGQLFADAVAKDPPVAAPSGGEGVRAFVYTCGQCVESQLIIGYLQKLNERALGAADRLDTVGEDEQMALYGVIQQGTLVAEAPESGEAPRWLPLMQPAGYELTQIPHRLCPDKTATICTPDDVR